MYSCPNQIANKAGMLLYSKVIVTAGYELLEQDFISYQKTEYQVKSQKCEVRTLVTKYFIKSFKPEILVEFHFNPSMRIHPLTFITSVPPCCWLRNP